MHLGNVSQDNNTKSVKIFLCMKIQCKQDKILKCGGILCGVWCSCVMWHAKVNGFIIPSKFSSLHQNIQLVLCKKSNLFRMVS